MRNHHIYVCDKRQQQKRPIFWGPKCSEPICSTLWVTWVLKHSLLRVFFFSTKHCGAERLMVDLPPVSVIMAAIMYVYSPQKWHVRYRKNTTASPRHNEWRLCPDVISDHSEVRYSNVTTWYISHIFYFTFTILYILVSGAVLFLLHFCILIKDLFLFFDLMNISQVWHIV